MTDNPALSTTSKSEQKLKTKQSTLRLEIGISDRLSPICKDNSINREVFLEALFESYQATPEVWESVLTEAKKKSGVSPGNCQSEKSSIDDEKV